MQHPLDENVNEIAEDLHRAKGGSRLGVSDYIQSVAMR